jgi:hypothetical protein
MWVLNLIGVGLMGFVLVCVLVALMVAPLARLWNFLNETEDYDDDAR